MTQSYQPSQENNPTQWNSPTTTATSQTREQLPILPDSEYDFVLYTDGSGHQDGYGGYAAVVVSKKFKEASGVVAGGMLGTTVNIAEFDAILYGLQSILLKLNIHEEKSFTRIFGYEKPTAIVVSDRMNLVGSINREFSRRTDPHLWRQFEWFEERMSIVARHVDRNTVVLQAQADNLASLSRLVIKDFILNRA